MHLEDILTIIFTDIAQAGMTPALDTYVGAVRQGSAGAQLAAWDALTEPEQTIVKHAYIRATRRGIAA